MIRLSSAVDPDYEETLAEAQGRRERGEEKKELQLIWKPVNRSDYSIFH